MTLRPDLPRRCRCALMALVGLVALEPACRSRASGPVLRGVTRPAAGRPATCPDDAVDPWGDGTPGPMDLRCSYADTTGGTITRVRGRVLREGPPGTPGESPGRTEVILYEAPKAIDGPLGRAVADATTDPQGAFSVGAVLRPGEYVVVVPGASDARPRARQRLTIGGSSGHRLDDVRLVIPRPMDEP